MSQKDFHLQAEIQALTWASLPVQARKRFISFIELLEGRYTSSREYTREEPSPKEVRLLFQFNFDALRHMAVKRMNGLLLI